MVVDNFDNLVDYFDLLKSKEDFYYIQVIQRKKDGHKKSERIVKNFYIYSKEEFLKKKDYIIELCNQHNARAYFWINPRNARKIALECIKSYADLIAQGDCTKGYKVWDKKCGANPAPGYERRWIVDIDSKDVDFYMQIWKTIDQCRGRGVYDVIPTLQGYHLITGRFDLRHFKQLCQIMKVDPIDVHEDNPTLLYYAKV
jgi:hypothetical protein